MIDTSREIFKWGPIDGHPIYIDFFVEAFLDYPDITGLSWPDCSGYFEGGKVTFYLDDERLRDRGQILFERDILDDGRYERAYGCWLETVGNIREFEERVNAGLEHLDDASLARLYDAWRANDHRFWSYGFLPEIANWGGERMLKHRLEGHAAFIDVFERITAPEGFSFFQQEELALLRIRLAPKERWDDLLDQHCHSYYWLRNSYARTRVLDAAYFRAQLEEIDYAHAQRRLEEIEGHPARIRAAREQIVAQHALDEQTVRMGARIGRCVLWQDERKQYIFIENHIATMFLTEIVKRKNVPFEDLLFYRASEIASLLHTGALVVVRERQRAMLLQYHENAGIEVLEGGQARSVARPYLAVNVDANKQEIKGMVVSKGKGTVSGKTRILHTPEVDTMREGEVLVAPMTSPDYILAMRKACAIVTDEGGMTSHAAIVSRELGIPCIVGTKIATHVLKDGDRVEIDVATGIVRKIT